MLGISSHPCKCHRRNIYACFTGAERKQKRGKLTPWGQSCIPSVFKNTAPISFNQSVFLFSCWTNANGNILELHKCAEICQSVQKKKPSETTAFRVSSRERASVCTHQLAATLMRSQHTILPNRKETCCIFSNGARQSLRC